MNVSLIGVNWIQRNEIRFLNDSTNSCYANIFWMIHKGKKCCYRCYYARLCDINFYIKASLQNYSAATVRFLLEWSRAFTRRLQCLNKIHTHSFWVLRKVLICIFNSSFTETLRTTHYRLKILYMIYRTNLWLSWFLRGKIKVVTLLKQNIYHVSITWAF